MAYDKAARPEGGFKRRKLDAEEKSMRILWCKENNEIDYKDVAKLRKYVSEREKLPRRITGNCAKTSESSCSSNQESSSMLH